MNNTVKGLLVSAAVMTASSASASIITNGSFEDLGSHSLSGSWDHITSIPGWTGQPNLEIQSNPTLRQIDAKDGRYYAELDTNQDAGISQDIMLSVGKYRLSFWYSPRVNASSTTTNDMNYSVADASNVAITSDIITGAPNNEYKYGEWTQVTDTFTVANAGTYTLSFFAQGGSHHSGCGNCGALLDDVTLSSVPLPASSLLLVAGVGLLGGIARRRAKRA